MQIEKTTNSMNRCDGLLHGINQDICIANVRRANGCASVSVLDVLGVFGYMF